ncbi:uncharacterized protein LOC143342043 [Colletes latitarsis]|uniref:uncharacterized protein LOC143342043 n=1 Tax=Colletes latitarsis TaxID=2605962 RepID=UPI004035F0D3
MSLEIRHNVSFCDILLQYFVKLTEVIPNIFKLIAATGFIVVISYMYYVHAHRCKILARESKQNLIGLQEIRNYNRSFIRDRSIISHKEMLNNLEYAADKCWDKFYALQCIDIVVYCPQLLNIKSPFTGLTPFHRICFQGHTCLIAFMLAKGADPFITTVKGENALCMAIYYFLNNPMQDDFSCLKILKSTGCNFGFKDQWYNILLQKAFTNNHIKLIQWLILHHEDPLHKTSRSTSIPPILKDY